MQGQYLFAASKTALKTSKYDAESFSLFIIYLCDRMQGDIEIVFDKNQSIEGGAPSPISTDMIFTIETTSPNETFTLPFR